MQVTLQPDDLRPLIQATVAEMLTRFGSEDRIAYSESESAAKFGERGHVLRDARLRGEIEGVKIGRSYTYTRAALLAWYESRRAAQ